MSLTLIHYIYFTLLGQLTMSLHSLSMLHIKKSDNDSKHLHVQYFMPLVVKKSLT